MYSSICSLVIGISSILRYITLLWRYLLVWPQADRTEDPVLRLGLRPECFQGPAPAQIVGEIFGGDTMEAAHPFFEPIGIHVVDVKIGHLRAGLVRGRQDVDRDRSLEGEGNDGGAAIAAELVGRRDDTTKGGRDGRPVQLGQHRIDRGAAAVSRDDDRHLFGGEAPLGRLTASLARSTRNAGPLAVEGFQNKRLIAFDNSRQILRLVQAQGFKKPVPPPECRRVSHRSAAFETLAPSIRALACSSHLSFFRKWANGVFVRALKVRPQLLQRYRGPPLAFPQSVTSRPPQWGHPMLSTRRCPSPAKPSVWARLGGAGIDGSAAASVPPSVSPDTAVTASASRHSPRSSS